MESSKNIVFKSLTNYPLESSNIDATTTTTPSKATTKAVAHLMVIPENEVLETQPQPTTASSCTAIEQKGTDELSKDTIWKDKLSVQDLNEVDFDPVISALLQPYRKRNYMYQRELDRLVRVDTPVNEG